MLFNGVYVLWEDPLVLSCLGEYDRARFLDLKLRATVLCFPEWLRTWRRLPSMIRDYVVGRRLGKSIHYLCCSPDEHRVLKVSGLPGTLVSQNTYIDERIFKATGAAKRFDAVYAAQMKPFKRLQLTAKVAPLYVVTYGDTQTPAGEFDLHRFEPAVRHAEFNQRWMSFTQINDIYNEARVGLALSECEGANLATVEYMMAGLPVVSTPSRGGRELFFDDRFVRVVAPTPEAVEAGVAELIHREIDPAVVRSATLARIEQHRRKLCQYVQGVVRHAKATIPSLDRLYERIFGGDSGTRSVFVHSRDFASRGWV
jgi:glycosyltransferase involved in cell wall biosynthesis